MSKVIPFKAEHLECMEIREYEQRTVCSMPQFSNAVKQWELSRAAGTIISGGRILAVMGYMDLWKGVCEVYILPSKYAFEYPHAFARCIKRTLNSGIFSGYHRVQLRALDNDLHNRFNSFLGFRKEGILHKYDSEKSDFVMWARFEEET